MLGESEEDNQLLQLLPLDGNQDAKLLTESEIKVRLGYFMS